MVVSDDLTINLQQVAKVYRRRTHALRGVTLQVGRGEIFGLLGPNGAGKSTLVKIIVAVVKPTRALGNVLGQPVGHKPTLARLGYLPEGHRFPSYLTGRQVLEFFAALSRVDRPTRRRRASELLDQVGMTAWADRKITTYSKGMAQRIGLAQSLMNNPDLVLLDEPTDGVDPVGRREIRDLILRLREQGKTVFMNSHLLSELEMICDRVAILVQGMVARQGTLDELTRGQQWYEIELASEGDLRERVARALNTDWSAAETARCQFQSVHVELRGQLLVIGTADVQAIQPVIDALRQHNLAVRRITPIRQSLEDLFIQAVTDPVTRQTILPGAGGIAAAR